METRVKTRKAKERMETARIMTRKAKERERIKVPMAPNLTPVL